MNIQMPQDMFHDLQRGRDGSTSGTRLRALSTVPELTETDGSTSDSGSSGSGSFDSSSGAVDLETAKRESGFGWYIPIKNPESGDEFSDEDDDVYSDESSPEALSVYDVQTKLGALQLSTSGEESSGSKPIVPPINPHRLNPRLVKSPIASPMGGATPMKAMPVSSVSVSV